jgi:uncharacterized circularly permuted ATP-grasp superfamily protein
LKVAGKSGAIMPASGEPLTAAQIATLRAWIDEGRSGQVVGQLSSTPTTHDAVTRPRCQPKAVTLRTYSKESIQNGVHANIAGHQMHAAGLRQGISLGKLTVDM